MYRNTFAIFVAILTALFFTTSLPIAGASDAPSDVTMSAQDILYRGIERCDSVIELREAKISVEEGLRIYRELLMSQPQFFYIGRQVGYSYSDEGYLLELFPAYLMTGDALFEARDKYISCISAFFTSLHIKKELSEWEKALLIHDYLAYKYMYSPEGDEIYNAYELFTQGHGVCQGFALAFLALGTAWDLDVDVVTSDTMDHAWNHVRIDGRYYHLDVTRDLPTVPGDSQGIKHERFLLSDEGAQALGYTAYICINSHSCDHHIFEDSNKTSIFGVYEGRIYPTGYGSIGINTEGNIQFFTYDTDGQHITKGLDTNGNGMTGVDDLVYLIYLYPQLSSREKELFRLKLLESHHIEPF